MSPRLIYPLLVATLALPAPQAVALDDFERFQSYPYLDRGYRQARQENWGQVERLMRHLLGEVPDNQDARELLVQALLHQGRYAEAQRQVAKLDGAQAEAMTQAIRLARIEHEPDIEGQVASWLETTRGARRERLWTAYSLALQARQGEAAALDWLLGLEPRGDATALSQRRAILAEQLERWPTVIDQLAPLQASGQLGADGWRRLAQAYIQRGRRGELTRLLATPPSPAAGRDVRVAASQQAIAAGDDRQAKHWLSQMEADAALSAGQRRQLLELARQTEDVDRVIALSRATGESCLGLAQWLSERAPSRAHEALRRCEPEEDPKAWLVLARRLGAEALLQQVTLPSRWESQRREQLVALWREKGQTSKAVAWLADQPQTPAVMRQRAQLLQVSGRPLAAARLWERHHERTGSLDALDRASFLYLQNARPERALALLEGAFDRRARELPDDVLARLVSLYGRNETPLSDARAKHLLAATEGQARSVLLNRLADNGACERVTRAIGESPDTPGAWRALGSCAMPKRPGAAVVYYRHAVDAGDVASRQPLAFALQAAGDGAGAHRLWQAMPSGELDSPAHLAAARSALAVGDTDTAARHWAASEHRTAEAWQLGAQIALARQRPDVARQRQRRALALDPSAERHYAAAGVARTLGDEALSLDWLHEAVRQAPDNPRYRADYGSRLAGSDEASQRRAAIPSLERSVAAYPEDVRLHETLALRYTEAGENDAARGQLRRAIDREQTPLAVEGATADAMVERRYRQRRLHETLGRRDRVTLSSTWSPAATQAGTRTRGGEQNTQILEWDHALGEEPIDNGRQLALYGRAILDSRRHSRVGESYALGVGLRAKPFTALNLNLYAELYGESRGHEGLTLDELVTPWRGVEAEEGGTKQQDTDLLLRASASFLDQGEYRSDWRPTRSHWDERSLYLDAAWWTQDDERQVLARYRQGHTVKLPVASPQTLMPYATLQFTGRDAEGWQSDTRAGVGLRWRYWFDADRYNAYRGSVALRLEYQHALSGELYDRNGGWLTGIEVSF